jgi:hypothetical protein
MVRPRAARRDGCYGNALNDRLAAGAGARSRGRLAAAELQLLLLAAAGA